MQHRLVTEVFCIQKIALVQGWSMGAHQHITGARGFRYGRVHLCPLRLGSHFCEQSRLSQTDSERHLQPIPYGTTSGSPPNSTWSERLFARVLRMVLPELAPASVAGGRWGGRVRSSGLQQAHDDRSATEEVEPAVVARAP
jgi:hypothetical protein